MGHCSAIINWFDDAIWNLLRNHKCTDNTLLYDASMEEVPAALICKCTTLLL